MSEVQQEGVTGVAAVDSRVRAIEQQLSDLLIKVEKVTTLLYGKSSDIEEEKTETSKEPFSFSGQLGDICHRCNETSYTINRINQEMDRFNS